MIDPCHDHGRAETLGVFTIDVFKGVIDDNATTTIPLTLTFHSSIFGSGSKKYFPLSAMNGFILVLTLNTANTALQVESESLVFHTHQSDTCISTNSLRVRYLFLPRPFFVTAP